MAIPRGADKTTPRTGSRGEYFTESVNNLPSYPGPASMMCATLARSYFSFAACSREWVPKMEQGERPQKGAQGTMLYAVLPIVALGASVAFLKPFADQ